MIGTIGMETEILLNTTPTIMSELTALSAAFGRQDKRILHRNSSHVFVCPRTHPHCYLPHCFPWLYPLGRGCPSDINNRTSTMIEYVKQVLTRGGGPNGRGF